MRACLSGIYLFLCHRLHLLEHCAFFFLAYAPNSTTDSETEHGNNGKWPKVSFLSDHHFFRVAAVALSKCERKIDSPCV